MKDKSSGLVQKKLRKLKKTKENKTKTDSLLDTDFAASLASSKAGIQKLIFPISQIQKIAVFFTINPGLSREISKTNMAAAALRNRNNKKHKRSIKFENGNALHAKENISSAKLQRIYFFILLSFVATCMIFYNNKQFKRNVDVDDEHNHIKINATTAKPKGSTKLNKRINKVANSGTVFKL